MKGEHIITASAVIFGIPNMGGHQNCFKLQSTVATGAEKEVILAAESANLKTRWIYAIECFIMECKQADDRDKLAQRVSLRGPRTVQRMLPEEATAADEESITKALEQKSRSMINMVEKFIKSWMEGDELVYSSTVTAGSGVYFRLLSPTPLLYLCFSFRWIFL